MKEKEMKIHGPLPESGISHHAYPEIDPSGVTSGYKEAGKPQAVRISAVIAALESANTQYAMDSNPLPAMRKTGICCQYMATKNTTDKVVFSFFYGTGGCGDAWNDARLHVWILNPGQEIDPRVDEPYFTGETRKEVLAGKANHPKAGTTTPA